MTSAVTSYGLWRASGQAESPVLALPMTRSLGLIVWLFERHMKVTPNPTLDGLPITKEEYDRATSPW